MIRFALPVQTFEGLSSKVFEHFGQSESFAIVEIDGDQILSVNVIHIGPSPDSNEIKPAEFFADHSVNIILTGNIGPCHTNTLLDRGIRLYSGANGTVKEALGKYYSDRLKEVKKSRQAFY